jgi:hypothetical protein
VFTTPDQSAVEALTLGVLTLTADGHVIGTTPATTEWLDAHRSNA